jgi:hypothetical protein
MPSISAQGMQTTIQRAPAPDATADELVGQAITAYQKKDFAGSARLFEAAIKKGARQPDVLYNAACSLALSGESEKAIRFLIDAIAAGFRDVENLKLDPDLQALRSDARWAKAVADCEAGRARYLEEHRDPEKARFITADIQRFWKAYDAALAASPEQRAAILQRDYVDPGSVGLKDFSRSGRLDAPRLAKRIGDHSDFFKAIRTITGSIETQRAATVSAFRKFKQIYPEAVFPDVYFVMGQLQSGGTASPNGLLMGAEMFTRSEAVPTGELSEWEKGAIMAQSEIPPLVAHESVHFQQKIPQGGLLCSCLREGSADFIGELVSGRLITRMRDAHAWANQRESELWEEVQKDMNGTSTARWLYGNSGGDGRPVDLGYWVGYKISEAYYRNAADKKRAVRDILNIGDCKEFLKASRYGDKFAAARPAT